MAEEKKENRSCENCRHNGEVIEYNGEVSEYKGSFTICGDTDYVCTRWEKKYSGYGYHGGGRKPKGEEPKTTTMSIVCTASERAKIKELAKNSGLSISGFVLAAINYFYEKELLIK